MPDTLLAIMIICDADHMAKNPRLADVAGEWTVTAAVTRYDRAGYETAQEVTQ